MNQDQADESGFNDAFEIIALERIKSEIAPIFWRHGHGLVEKSFIAVAEQLRVAAVIARDQIDRAKERDRKLAEIEVRGGVFVNLSSTVIEPTPEWLAKGEVRSFTPKQPDDTVRVIKSVRRVSGQVLARMRLDGRITDDQFVACLWYRKIYEQAGVAGRYKSSNLSLAGNVGSGGGTGQHPMALHHFEAEARAYLRSVCQELNKRFLPVFDYVVINDFSLRKASVHAKRDNARLLENFRSACNSVLRYMMAEAIETDDPENEGY